MLEQQQGQLVSGLQEMYRRLSAAKAWEGPALSEANGHPLTHDILAALNLLESKQDGSGEVESFEEDCQKLQSKLLAEGAGYAHRRGSISSDSDHSSHGHSQSTHRASPPETKPTFRDSFHLGSAASSPLSRSPVPQQKQPSFPSPQQLPMQQPSPLANDPQFYRAEWALPDMSNPEQVMRSKFAMQIPNLHEQVNSFDDSFGDQPFAPPPTFFDAGNNFGGLPVTSYPQQLSSGFGGPMPGLQQDFGLGFDPMEFEKYIQVAT
jgi:hypothetical protein